MKKYHFFVLILLFLPVSFSCQIFSTKAEEGFVHTKAAQIVDKSGNPLTLRSMGMGNIIYCYPKTIDELANHHNESAYKELSDLGFNCVRFLLNYQLFEDDEKPYEYKADGFDWIRQNIEWAKKYNILIVLNMHVPEGGYQSQGEGQELWCYNNVYDGNENQERLCALWKKIADEFKDESTIVGYGIVNEPTALYIPPQGDETEKAAIKTAINHWDYLANKITEEIRKVDKNHIIFVENCSVRDYDLNWISTTGFETYPEIDDDNLVYEFHNYNPFYYTHQEENPDGCNNHIYPDEEYSELTYISWLGQKTERIIGDDEHWNTEWQKLTYTISSAEVKEEFPDAGIFNIKVAPSYLVDETTGISGKLFIDDVQLDKIDENGNVTNLITCNFDEETLWSIGSDDGSAKISYNSTEGKTAAGCLEYSSSNYNSWSGYTGKRFNFENNSNYCLTLWYKTENMPEAYKTKWSGFGFDIIQGSIKYGLNYDFLYQNIKDSADYFNEKGKPCFCGEFGCKRICFDENRGGKFWVSDTMSIFNKLGLSYSYHAYHEQSFGLHNSDATIWGSLPSDEDLCVDLAEVFKIQNAQ